MTREQQPAEKRRFETAGSARTPFLDIGLKHQQAGRLDQAVACYRQALAQDPANASALHFLGLALLRQGDPTQAAEQIGKALAAKPDYPEAHNDLGVILAVLGKNDEAIAAHRRAIAIKRDYADAYAAIGGLLRSAGKIDEAADCLRHAVAINPNIADWYNNLGVTLRALGKSGEAIAAYRSAIAIRPDSTEAHYNLGNALAALGKPDEAIAAYRRALAVRPDYAAAYAGMATAYRNIGKLDEAVACLRRAIAIDPNVADWHRNLGIAFEALGKNDEAIAAHRRALAVRPDYAEVHAGMATAYRNIDKLDEAVACLRRAIAIDPNVAEWHRNLGIALEALGKPERAADAHRRAITLRPDDPEAHYCLSLSLLAAGNFRQGFEEYRWRWKSINCSTPMPSLSCPHWEGESLAGKSILAHCEQGYGDCLQFVRYVRPLTRIAGRVSLLAYPPLAGLFGSIPGVEVVTAPSDEHDYFVPLLCLPRLFATTLDTIPADVPYLAVDPAKCARWAARLSPYEGTTKIGLAWAGAACGSNRAASEIDRRRSMSLQQFSSLAGIANVQFFSLQKEERAAEALHPPNGMNLIDMTSDLHDFEDTAALISNLDLVVSVDTSVAHLAGALGKPVWVLSRFAGCWRWFNGREDSPWYPTARIFYQQAPGAWGEVMARVAAELVKLTTKMH